MRRACEVFVGTDDDFMHPLFSFIGGASSCHVAIGGTGCVLCLKGDFVGGVVVINASIWADMQTWSLRLSSAVRMGFMPERCFCGSGSRMFPSFPFNDVGDEYYFSSLC